MYDDCVTGTTSIVSPDSSARGQRLEFRVHIKTTPTRETHTNKFPKNLTVEEILSNIPDNQSSIFKNIIHPFQQNL